MIIKGEFVNMNKLLKHGFSFKLPDSNIVGMKLIIKLIPSLSDKKLLGVKGLIETYPNSPERQEIIKKLREEFDKRGIIYYDLS